MNKQQVLAIHGGGEFISLSGKELKEEIAARDVSLDRLRQKGSWKSNLQEDLGDMYDVLAPRMPQPDTPHYELWKTLFEKIEPLLEDEVVLVGHSLGGLFLVKYLSERTFLKKIRGLFLVATPYTDSTNEVFRESGFATVESLVLLSAQVPYIHIYHSEDDEVVPIESLEQYRHVLPQANTTVFKDKKHFNGEHFPELVADIQAL